jgi:L-asparaginase
LDRFQRLDAVSLRSVIRVRALRGEHVESEHEVIVGGDEVVFARSALKPLQVLPAVRAGVPERFGLDDRHVAIACGSHGGSDAHVAVVAEILAAAGLGEEALCCGASAPRDPAVRADPAPIRHNCSGKHALGLALCVAERWPLEGYCRAGHPLQNAMRAAVAEAVGIEHPEAGVDGCGMCAFRVPLDALGAAFAALDERVARAMLAHPELVAYEGAVDTELLRRGTLAKVGAEGVLAWAGGALKVRDGAMRAADAAAALLFELPPVPVLNSRGEVVGRLEAERV